MTKLSLTLLARSVRQTSERVLEHFKVLGLRSIRMIRTINGVFIKRSLGVFTCNVCVSTHEVTVYVSSIYLGILVVLYDTHTIGVEGLILTCII